MVTPVIVLGVVDVAWEIDKKAAKAALYFDDNQ